MKAEEYDHFLDDPTDFLIRIYLPRTDSALAGLGMLPPLRSLVMGVTGLTPLLPPPSPRRWPHSTRLRRWPLIGLRARPHSTRRWPVSATRCSPTAWRWHPST